MKRETERLRRVFSFSYFFTSSLFRALLCCWKRSRIVFQTRSSSVTDGGGVVKKNGKRWQVPSLPRKRRTHGRNNTPLLRPKGTGHIYIIFIIEKLKEPLLYIGKRILSTCSSGSTVGHRHHVCMEHVRMYGRTFVICGRAERREKERPDVLYTPTSHITVVRVALLLDTRTDLLLEVAASCLSLMPFPFIFFLL